MRLMAYRPGKRVYGHLQIVSGLTKSGIQAQRQSKFAHRTEHVSFAVECIA